MEIIDERVFNKEIGLCKQLSNENSGGCNWGRCKDCGVLPLLYKLHKGELLEEQNEILEIKKTAKLIIENRGADDESKTTRSGDL